MKHTPKAWLVAYDIREPRRLRQVHRCLKKRGVPAQYSAFTVEAHDVDLARLLDTLRHLIDENVDDVRGYHLPATCTVWSLGRQQWPDGICLAGSHAARLLLHTVASDAEPEPHFPGPRAPTPST